MKKYKTIDGNTACSNGAYLFTEIAPIYPITPSSVMAELVDEWSASGKKNIFDDEVKVVQMQSEAGAAALLHGVLQTGVLGTTFTSSQGLLLMIPNMYKMAGEMLPAVMHVAARSLSTHALSILGDHQDIYACRMTGFGMLSSANVQEAQDLAVVAHLSALEASLPMMHFFDGFRTSHQISKIEMIEKEDVLPLVDFNKVNEFRKRSLSHNNVVRGTTQNEDIYFQATEVRNQDYMNYPDIVNRKMTELGNITGRTYKPFMYYGDPAATDIIVAMGSVTETIQETIDVLNQQGYKVGVVIVHLYRPFSSKYFFDVVPNTVKHIAVLDRTKEPGSAGEPLYLDVVSMFQEKEGKPLIIGGRYGLSSKDTNPADIKAVYDFLGSDKPFHGFTIGIEDDVTNLSLKPSNFEIHHDGVEALIYGYGSDGMVSCSKDFMKIIGDNTDYHVQGYFQYDSKKSGGLTRSHLRLRNSEIRSVYYVSRPNLVVCSKESYLGIYDMLTNIQQNGIFLLVTTIDKDTIDKVMTSDIRKIILSKNIKFYIIDAYNLANEYGLQNKISMILLTAIFKITNILPFETAFVKVREMISWNFKNKGEKIVNANLAVVEHTVDYLYEVKLTENLEEELTLDKFHSPDKIFNMMNNLKGNDLKVSDFLNHKDGTYINNTTKYEKRGIAENIPHWIKDKCIQCNQCSFVCPHAVIRPYLLNQEEYDKAPDVVKQDMLGATGSEYKFKIAVSTMDCTGCGVCARTCPTAALEMKPFDETNHRNGIDYLMNEVTTKEDQYKPNIKGTQFRKPLFEFHGACAGCGETPYLKLLTQIFGSKLVIANATGCSSIYGGSMPSSPYNVPWANSLFEDNAEYGYGMVIAYNQIRNRIKDVIMSKNDALSEEDKTIVTNWLNDSKNEEYSNALYQKVDTIFQELSNIKDYIKNKSHWMVGGDGWAYDIGFGGIDHVLASGENVNILVLDSQLYSNTGGQASKASEKGSVSKFASNGKGASKKELSKMLLTYPNVYVAQVALGANMPATINAFVEAEKYNGPSIIIAYSPCISHGIKGGMGNMIEQERKAVKSGYLSIFRYNPETSKFTLDFKNPDFNTYFEFLESENRFASLKLVNEEKATKLFEQAKEDAIKRFEFYKKLEENNPKV